MDRWTAILVTGLVLGLGVFRPIRWSTLSRDEQDFILPLRFVAALTIITGLTLKLVYG